MENIGSFRDRKAFWDEKDEEEKKKRESVSSVEDYTQGIENSAFVGVEVIDKSQTLTTTHSQQPLRTPSPYEIERSKEAVFLDTDEPEDPDKTESPKIIFRERKEEQVATERVSSMSVEEAFSISSGRDSVDKSEIETSEKGPGGHSDNSLREARCAG